MYEIDKIEQKMEQVITHLKDEFTKISTGRANPVLLQNLMINYYEKLTPLFQIANIQAPEARQLVVKPFDKSIIHDIMGAINKANLGYNPIEEGGIIRINIPQLNEETRKLLIKKASEYAESAKVAIRNVRREANEIIKELKEKKEFTEDDVKESLNEIQQLTDKKIQIIETIFKQKEESIITI